MLGSAPRGQAADYAVLVGVGNYELEGVTDLQGPPNDVRMMQEALRDRNVPDANMAVLADGIPGAALPTRAAIMDALNAVVDKIDEATPGGDSVTLYFSGHGTRQPDRNDDETDGLDELFLPMDIRKWDGSNDAQAQVPNAIVDDELGVLVAAMRAKNATVWVIMDSCHSGSGTRFAQRDVRARQVPTSVFGFHADPLAVTVEEKDDFGAPGIRQEDALEKGGFVAFFAAQAFQQAVEVAMERDDDGTKTFYGLFTAHLAQRLKTSPDLSFRQLFEAVKFDIEKYQADRGGSQWPAFEASRDAMEQVPISRGSGKNRTWRLAANNTITAGVLHGLRNGSVLAVYDDATAGDDDIVGYIQVRKSYALHAKYKVVEHPCKDTDAGLYCQQADAGRLGNATFARLIEPVVDVVLKVSAPQVVDEGDSLSNYAEVLDALKAVEAMSAQGRLGLTVLFDQDPYNVSLGLKDGHLWFGNSDGLAPAGIADFPSSIAWPEEKGADPDASDLAELLSRLGRIHNLATVAKEMTAQHQRRRLPPPLPLEITIEVARSDRAALADPQTDDLFEECEEIARDAPVALGEISGNLTQCDEVSITLQKTGDDGLDVTVLYKDARGAIHVLFPKYPGQNRIDGNRPNRLKIFGGPSLLLCAECPGEDGTVWSFGREEIYVIAAEADRAGVIDLSHLAQKALGTVATRSADRGDSLSDRLTDLVLGGRRTRGPMRRSKKRDMWIETFSWTLWPRDAMTRQAAQQ